MQRIVRFHLSVLCVAGLWVLVPGDGALAQQQRGKREAPAASQADREQVGKGKFKPRDLPESAQAEWQDGVPPGWTRGKKTGWGGADAPPGQRRGGAGRADAPQTYPRGAEDWDQQRREDWDRRLEDARERVRERARRVEGYGEPDVESAVISVEAAAREGVPVEQAEAAVNHALGAGLPGREIEQLTRALAYGVGRGVAADELSRFATGQIAAGQRGDDLAVAIYQEADHRAGEPATAPAPQEPKKSPWWKRIFGK